MSGPENAEGPTVEIPISDLKEIWTQLGEPATCLKLDSIHDSREGVRNRSGRAHQQVIDARETLMDMTDVDDDLPGYDGCDEETSEDELAEEWLA